MSKIEPEERGGAMTTTEPHRVDDKSYEESAKHWHAEVVRLRVVLERREALHMHGPNPTIMSVDEALKMARSLDPNTPRMTLGAQCVTVLAKEVLRLRDEVADTESALSIAEASLAAFARFNAGLPDAMPPWFEALAARIAEAEAKHARDDWADGTAPDFASGLYRTGLVGAHLCVAKNRLETDEQSGCADWLQILLCEVHELACETSDERIVDELLDVAAVALRWYGAKVLRHRLRKKDAELSALRKYKDRVETDSLFSPVLCGDILDTCGIPECDYCHGRAMP